MKHTNRKTHLFITMQPDGTAHIDLSWSDKDASRLKEDVAKEIIGEVLKLPDYEWLFKILFKSGWLKVNPTEAEFESLLDKASQPLEQPQKPDSKEAGTSESPTSGDCSENHTHSDSPEGT